MAQQPTHSGELPQATSARESTYREIHDLLCRFYQAFDTHDWPLLGECIADRVRTDYTSFRGTPEAVVDREHYVLLRRTALSTLRMQHNFSNLRIITNNGQIQGRCNYMIYRFAPDTETHAGSYFHSFGHYIFDFELHAQGWQISGITQCLLINQGDSTLHTGNMRS